MDWLILLAGLAGIIFGAKYLVDGASSLARRWGLSEFIIGLTIVGMGTSAPEMVVSFVGAIEGNADVSMGNILGSNIFNTLLILGVTALILPIKVTTENRKIDAPMNVLIALLLFALSLDSRLSRLDGIVFLLFFALYMWWSFRHQGTLTVEEDTVPERSIWLSVLAVLGGLALLVFGGRYFVDSAVAIARSSGVSDKFIAITLLAGGTSLPELATCVAAAARKKGQLALGNIIGSNVFNILLILGGSAVIHPLDLTGTSPEHAGFSYVDLGMLLLSALALLFAAIIGRKKEMGVISGTCFLLLFVGYLTYLIVSL
ncbi:MAG: calcium/sodium antiporter [Bacteroidales bacterium]|nr:calcium/sodium antiporter [Bacteroidales bacterium]